MRWAVLTWGPWRAASANEQPWQERGGGRLSTLHVLRPDHPIICYVGSAFEAMRGNGGTCLEVGDPWTSLYRSASPFTRMEQDGRLRWAWPCLVAHAMGEKSLELLKTPSLGLGTAIRHSAPSGVTVRSRCFFRLTTHKITWACCIRMCFRDYFSEDLIMTATPLEICGFLTWTGKRE